MKNVMFFDLQTNSYSAHTTIQGMFDMHKEDSLICCEEGDYKETKELLENMLLHEKIDYIQSHEYELILYPTIEDIRSWEEYHDSEWEF